MILPFRQLLAAVALMLAIPLGGSTPWLGPQAAAAPAAGNPSVRHIQRTMRSLAGERNPGEPVRILFYGQSITAQPWWRAVVDDLRRRYPEAKIEAANRAIRGFISPALRRTAAHDLSPFYPDLLVFHVYGDLENYEAIIREAREATTAEILLYTDHVAKDENRLVSDDLHSEGVRAVAERHGCMLIDARTQWKRHLAEAGLAPGRPALGFDSPQRCRQRTARVELCPGGRGNRDGTVPERGKRPAYVDDRPGAGRDRLGPREAAGARPGGDGRKTLN